MFKEHARKVLHQVGAKKNLICHENLTEKVDLLTLVKKKKKSKIFPPEYEVVPATLGDLVPAFAGFSEFEETTLIKDYTHTGLISGGGGVQTAVKVADASAKASNVKETSPVDINAKTADFCKMKEICPGQKINHVHMPTLREGEVLGFVSKIVFNTNEIHLHGRTKVDGSLAAFFKFIHLSAEKSNSSITLGTSATFCRYDVKDESFVVTEKIEGKMEDNTSFTVPARHIYGYRLNEIKFKEEEEIDVLYRAASKPTVHQYAVAVEPETFDPDDSTEETLETLQQVREKLLMTETVLQPLAHLPRVTRFVLFRGLSELSEDRDALTLLKLKLDQLRAGERLKFCSVCSVLRLFRGFTTSPPTEPEITDSTLEAVYLLVSAMDKLPEHVTSLIAKNYRGLNQLVSSLMENGQAPVPESLPAALQDGGLLHWLAVFLCSSDESLRESSELMIAARDEPGVLLLALCVAVRGLRMLEQ